MFEAGFLHRSSSLHLTEFPTEQQRKQRHRIRNEKRLDVREERLKSQKIKIKNLNDQCDGFSFFAVVDFSIVSAVFQATFSLIHVCFFAFFNLLFQCHSKQ